MAYKEISLVVARLVWLYEWRVAEGTCAGEGDPRLGEESLRHRVKELQGKDRFVLVHDGPVVQFRERRHGKKDESGREI